ACAEGRTGAGGGVAAGPPPGAAVPEEAAVASASVDEDAVTSQAAFDAALASRDADAAVAAVLGLEAALEAWAADPTQSDERNRARATLRGMATRLGQAAASGLVDRRDVVAPFVEALLALRRTARSEKRWGDADAIRDLLVAAGIEIRDHPDGTDWSAL
ncbi:MAG: hypothetical protein ACLGI3_09730, partial [Actinomycetes bacterium]